MKREECCKQQALLELEAQASEKHKNKGRTRKLTRHEHVSSLVYSSTLWRASSSGKYHEEGDGPRRSDGTTFLSLASKIAKIYEPCPNNNLNISGTTRNSGGYWFSASKVLLRPTGTHPYQGSGLRRGVGNPGKICTFY